MSAGNRLKNDLRIQRNYLEEIKEYIEKDDKEKAIICINRILKRIQQSLED